MILDTIKMYGDVNIDLFNADGVKIDNRSIHNLVVTAGKAFMTSRMKDATSTAMSHMAVGTTAATPDAANTTLAAQLSNRVAIDTTTNISNTIVYVCTFAPGVCSGAIVEAGIFNHATTGTMLARTTFGTVTKAALDTLVITWTITIS